MLECSIDLIPQVFWGKESGDVTSMIGEYIEIYGRVRGAYLQTITFDLGFVLKKKKHHYDISRMPHCSCSFIGLVMRWLSGNVVSDVGDCVIYICIIFVSMKIQNEIGGNRFIDR